MQTIKIKSASRIDEAPVGHRYATVIKRTGRLTAVVPYDTGFDLTERSERAGGRWGKVWFIKNAELPGAVEVAPTLTLTQYLAMGGR